MPATIARDPSPAPVLLPREHATAVTASLTFDALRGLHGLADRDAELLSRAAAGLRFIQSMEKYTTIERKLFRIALSGLAENDAFVVEAAAYYSADLVAYGDSEAWWRLSPADERRAMWFAAVLRLSDALCVGRPDAPTDAYAAWTDDIVYLEFDGDVLDRERLAGARARVAALEALTGRRAVLAASAERRGAA